MPLIREISSKWPWMIVTGKSVTIEQAMDIIVRIDGNACPGDQIYNLHDQVKRDFISRSGADEISKIARYENRQSDIWRLNGEFLRAIKYIELEYICTYNIFSSYIYGNHGFMSSTGKIAYANPIGKYPSMEEIMNEWKTVANEFPFLDLNVTISDQTYDENDQEVLVPCFNIRVIDGAATIEDPNPNVHLFDDSPISAELYTPYTNDSNHESMKPIYDKISSLYFELVYKLLVDILNSPGTDRNNVINILKDNPAFDQLLGTLQSL